MFKKIQIAAGTVAGLAVAAAPALAVPPDYTTAVTPITEAATAIGATVPILAAAALGVAGSVLVVRFGWRFVKGLATRG